MFKKIAAFLASICIGFLPLAAFAFSLDTSSSPAIVSGEYTYTVIYDFSNSRIFYNSGQINGPLPLGTAYGSYHIVSFNDFGGSPGCANDAEGGYTKCLQRLNNNLGSRGGSGWDEIDYDYLAPAPAPSVWQWASTGAATSTVMGIGHIIGGNFDGLAIIGGLIIGVPLAFYVLEKIMEWFYIQGEAAEARKVVDILKETDKRR